MSRTLVSKQVDADAEQLWRLLENFGDVSWIPFDIKVEVQGQGPGMSRSIVGTGPDPVVETLVALDGAARTLTYTIHSATMPFPVTEYTSTASVTGGEATTIAWAVDFVPTGDEQEAAAAIDGMYGLMATWLETAANAS